MRANRKKISQPGVEGYRHLVPHPGSEEFEKNWRTTKEIRDTSFIEKSKKVMHAKKEWNPIHFRNFGPVN